MIDEWYCLAYHLSADIICSMLPKNNAAWLSIEMHGDRGICYTNCLQSQVRTWKAFKISFACPNTGI